MRRRVGKPVASATASDPSAKDESPTLKNPKEREPSRQLRVAASISPTVACHSASAPEKEQGKPECGNTLPRGEHEQLVSREDPGLNLERWETFWRTSGSAKARKVLGVKAQNANPTPPVGLAWRIRIGNGHLGGDTKRPSRCGFLICASFSERGFGGEETLSIFAPRLTHVVGRLRLCSSTG